jgi:allantoinase
VRWMCERPAALAGLDHKKGKIAVGFDADLVVFDPRATTVVAPEAIQHRHRVTPYAGETLRGAVIATYLRGTCVARRGSVIAENLGALL